jgi:hypothetical protein
MKKAKNRSLTVTAQKRLCLLEMGCGVRRVMGYPFSSASKRLCHGIRFSSFAGVRSRADAEFYHWTPSGSLGGWWFKAQPYSSNGRLAKAKSTTKPSSFGEP